MYELLDISLAVLLSVLVLAAWIGNLIGMPGNWISVAIALVCWWFAPVEWRIHMELGLVIWDLAWAAIGELIEFLAGAVGARRAGGGIRSTVLSVVGSIGGGVAGLFIGTAIPIPVVGSVIGAILLGGAGAFVGALLGERWAGQDWNASIQVGTAAFWGRLIGTVGKVVCGTLVAAGSLAGLVFA